MNLFYHDATRDHSELLPTSLEEGQVCLLVRGGAAGVSDACVRVLSGVCGVLVGEEGVVSGPGGGGRRGLVHVARSLLPGRPRTPVHFPLRPVRPEPPLDRT